MLSPLLINSSSLGYQIPTQPRLAAEKLANADNDEVLSFLGTETLHTAYLSGLIRDNGIVNPTNRGSFYGYRNERQELEGIALIGHAILIEAKTHRSLRAFAEAAKGCTTSHMILCEENRIDEFWRHYAPGGQEMRRASRQLLFELRWPTEVSRAKSILRPATIDDLDLLIPVHAEMARTESGVDPLETDPIGFAQRYSKRIMNGQTWVSMSEGKLAFKAEVVNETPEMTHIEGVWVSPELRRQRFGLGCMSQLAKMLLWRTKCLCLLVNDENEAAACFARQAGYHLRGVYDTIFLK